MLYTRDKNDKEIVKEGLRGAKVISLANIRGDAVTVAESKWVNNQFTYSHRLNCIPYYLILYTDRESVIWCPSRNEKTITFECTQPCSCAIYLLK